MRKPRTPEERAIQGTKAILARIARLHKKYPNAEWFDGYQAPKEKPEPQRINVVMKKRNPSSTKKLPKLGKLGSRKEERRA